MLQNALRPFQEGFDLEQPYDPNFTPFLSAWTGAKPAELTPFLTQLAGLPEPTTMHQEVAMAPFAPNPLTGGLNPATRNIMNAYVSQQFGPMYRAAAQQEANRRIAAWEATPESQGLAGTFGQFLGPGINGVGGFGAFA